MVAAEYATCRSGRHPAAMRLVDAQSGRTDCAGCRDEIAYAKHLLRPVTAADVVADPERQARFTAWSAGLDDAIAEARRLHGFDGRKRAWRTLGDVVGMQAPLRPAPAPEPVVEPVAVPARRADPRRRIWRPVICADCGEERPWGHPCPSCTAAAASKLPPIVACPRCETPKYEGTACAPCAAENADRRRRFQEAASAESGVIFDLVALRGVAQ